MRNMKCIQSVSMSILVVLLVVVCASTVSAKTMKIAVPATSSEKDSLISQETGRAPFFLLFDEKGHFLEAIKNPAIAQEGGISRTVVILLVNSDVTTLITESIGKKMKQALTKHQIDLVIKTGTATDAVKSIIQH